MDPDAMKCSNGQHVREGTWWEYDGQGIPLCRVCAVCQEERLAQYRTAILSPYTQDDVDEDIEPESDGWQDDDE